jgi:hypothetical protein
MASDMVAAAPARKRIGKGAIAAALHSPSGDGRPDDALGSAARDNRPRLQELKTRTMPGGRHVPSPGGRIDGGVVSGQ